MKPTELALPGESSDSLRFQASISRNRLHRRFPALNLWLQDDLRGIAEIMTRACATGPSSVIVTSIRASQPGGVIASSRLRAPPVSSIVGRPDGRLTTPMSRQKTPPAIPVPRALAQASLAANRLA